LHDRTQANQHDKQLEKVRQSTVIGELVDSPKTDGPNHDNSQNPYEN
jgi:hypothetical protein